MGRQRRPALAAGMCAAVAVAVVAVMLIGTRWHGGGAMRDTELAAAVVSGPQVIYLKRARGIGCADAMTRLLANRHGSSEWRRFPRALPPTAR